MKIEKHIGKKGNGRTKVSLLNNTGLFVDSILSTVPGTKPCGMWGKTYVPEIDPAKRFFAK